MSNDHLIQGSASWLDMRKNCVGASDAAAILGVSPWVTPYGLWSQKMGLIVVEQNDAMRRGVEMEPLARDAFNRALCVTVEPKVYFDDVYPWCMASLDGVSADGKTVVEIKCCGQKDHQTALDGMIPEKYYPQLQHQLYVTGLKQINYFSYRSELDFVNLVVKRDDIFIGNMLEAEKEFYRRMIEFDAPPLTEQDYQDFNSDKDFEYASMIYLDAVKARKEAEKNEGWAKEQMISKANGNAKNRLVRITKYFRKGNVQYDKIPELEKVDLEKYRKAAVASYRISEVTNGNTA